MADAVEFDVSKEGLSFLDVSTRGMASSRWDDILAVQWLHAKREFIDKATGEKERKPADIERLTGDVSRRSWVNLNHLVRGGGRNPRQRYARQRVVAAIDSEGTLRAFLRYNDNASSKLPFPLGTLERGAKLYTNNEVVDGIVDRFSSHSTAVDGRWRVVEELALRDEELPGVEHLLGHLMMNRSISDQPGAAYPWEEETSFRRTLELWGFTADGRRGEDEYPFGPGTQPVNWDRFAVSSMSHAAAQIRAIPGASPQVMAAQQYQATL